MANAAWAGNLTLVGGDIVWDPTSEGPVSPVLTIGLENDISPDSESLLGWQLRLQIVPIAAVGTLGFESGQEPSTSYLLDGVSGGFVSLPSGSTLFAFDDDQTLAGVEVPASGATLIDLTFETFNNARGEFRLMAVPGLANSQWSDGEFLDRGFANVPLEGTEAIPLATVTVVPEPGSIILFALGMLIVFCEARLRRVRFLERPGGPF